MADNSSLSKMAQRLRRLCMESTTAAGSGHPTSCMSAAEIMSVLFVDDLDALDGPVSIALSTFVGSQRLTLMPKPSTSPRHFRPSAARRQPSSSRAN